ncbi:MAG: hypothetical protein JW787_11520 [Sedimentisphaerales bacterium]|nr:hypothetical protein [Sedimentisphaerales bacterium]
MKKMMLLLTVILAFVIVLEGQVQAAPADTPTEIDAVYVGEDGFEGFDDTSGFSTTNNGTEVSLLTSSLSLLGGFGQLNAWLSTDTDTPTGVLTHRGARGLGVLGGEDGDEIDNDTLIPEGRDEYVQIVFAEPVWISAIQVRSLFIDKFGPGPEDDVHEQAEVMLYKNTEWQTSDTISAVQSGGNGVANLNYVSPVLADEVILQIPAGNASEYAFARLVFYYDEAELIPGIDVEKYVSDTICGCCNWDDADEPAGPVILVGDDVYWLYLVTNTGEVPLTDVVLKDDNGTDDPSDDWEPWYLWGDVGNDGTLGLDEVWVYLAKDKAIAGQYENWGYIEGWYGSTVVTDEDPANYYGQEQLEGCTPGFWKNNAERWHASAWEGYSPCDSFADIFGVEITIFKGGNPKKQSSYNNDPTLLQALGANGSGINLLARAAVAALLNAANPDVAYAMSVEDIIAAVQEAVDEGEDAVQNLGELLDDYNNAGCPLNQKGCPLFPTNCSSSQNKPNKPNKPYQSNQQNKPNKSGK